MSIMAKSDLIYSSDRLFYGVRQFIIFRTLDSSNIQLTCRGIYAKNVAPLWGEHGSVAASTVFKPQPHINASAA